MPGLSKGTVNCTSYLSASAQKTQEQDRLAANLRVARVLSSYMQAAKLGYHSIKSLRQMGLEVKESERQNPIYLVEFQGCRLSVYSLQQCVGKDMTDSSASSSRQMDGTALRGGSESHAVVGPFARIGFCLLPILNYHALPSISHLMCSMHLKLVLDRSYRRNRNLSDPRVPEPPAWRISRRTFRRRTGQLLRETKSTRRWFSTNSTSSGTSMGSRRTSSCP